MWASESARANGRWSLAVLAAVVSCAGWGLGSILAGDAPKLQATEASDYRITAAHGTTVAGTGAYEAVNRAQGLHMDFVDAGVRILPQAGESPWAVGLTLGAYGPLDGAQAVLGGATKVQGARAEQSFRGGVSGWYANSEDGLIQGFTIDRPAGPPNAENLNFHEIDIAVATEGVEIRTIADGSVIFVTSGRRETLRWALAGGTDARGATVRVKTAVIIPTDGSAPWLQLVLVVEPWAQYPVQVQMRLDTQELKGEEGAETSSLAPLAPPPEDTCAGAQVIPAGTYPVLSTTVNNSLATDTGDPTNTCQPNSHLGLWYTFTPTANDNYIIRTCNPPTATTRSDTVLAVYTSASGCAGPLTQVACDDDACDPGLQSLIGSVALTAGTTYYILGYSYSTTGGDIQIEISRPLPPPAEDTCPGAQVIPGGGPWPALTTVVDNTWATSTNDAAATCSTSEALGLWYTFTPAVDGPYYITTCQNMAPGSARQDTVLDIFTSAGGCAGPFTEVASGCNDNNTECEGHTLQSLIQPTLTAGTTYYILAYNYGTTTKGNIQLYIEPSPAAPPNDQCPGAQAIPGAGPWPYLTTTVDITNATTTGDPTIWSCITSGHVAWYEFTPAASGTYNFTTCKNAAPGTTCLDTTLSVYTSSTNACGGTYTQVSGACNDTDSACTGTTGDATMSVTMTAGQKYYVLAGSPGTTVPQPGRVQLQVTFTAPPPNDNCSAPVPVVPNVPVAGTTAGAFNDYQLSATTPTCFTLPTPPAPLGQTASTVPGREVVYEFIPPTSGNYSCRAYSYNTAQNLVVYVATYCPAATPGAPVTITNPPCVGASNRSTTSWQEEVMCVPMTGGQPYFVFVDDNVSGNAGSAFYVKCTPCVREVESNNTPLTANQFVCGMEGSIDPAGDVDFFQLTGATSNSRVFMLADGGAASSNDFDMRITNATDTLQYDDLSADTPYGGLAPSIDGTTLANGPPYYIRMNHYSATTAAEPYRLYGVIEPPHGTEIPETEPNDAAAQANANPLNYFSGTMSALADADWYVFTANAGDIIFVGLDTDPNYDGGADNLALTLYDATGVAVLVTVNGSTGTTPTLNRPPTLGNLAATLPIAYGEELEWNAASTGTYFVKVTNAGTTFGKEYALAIAKNCQTDSTDFGVTKSDGPDPIATGQDLTYTVVVTNNGPGAGGGTMQDTLPAGTTFVSVAAPGWTCTAPPVGGTGTVSCSGALAAGGTTAITIVVKVGWCLGNGYQIANAATVTASGTDPDPSNNGAATTTTVTDLGACSDNDACTLGDVCQGNVCVPGPPKDCNDGDICTVDTCNRVTGDCVHTDMCELDVFPASRARIDMRFPPDMQVPHIVHLTGPTTVRVNLGLIGDPDGDAREQVPTEMLQLSLTGMDPNLGLVHVRLQQISPPHPFPPATLGEIEETANPTPNLLDVPPFNPVGPPAESFFDVFFEVELVDMGMVLHNHVPKHMTALIRHKPPAPGDAYENPVFIDLFDANDNPMPVLVGPGLHVPNPCTSNSECNDNNLCTTDVCNLVTGACEHAPLDCNDDNVCTFDTCNPTSGCEHTPTLGATCDDGALCTVNDTCACASGQSLSENFDTVVPPALPAGWTTQLLTGLAGDAVWTTVGSFFDSPPYAAHTDNPTHITDKVLVSPPFTGLGGTSLIFKNKYDLESTFDGGVLEIKVGAGAWTDIITAGGVWVSGGYNGTISTTYQSPIAGRQAWTGASTGFVTTEVTLPASVTGQTVQLRWRVATDTSLGNTGQWIDTVVIPVCSAVCAGAPKICTALDQCHDPGICDPATGLCSDPAKPDGTFCDDANPCTSGDACVDGTCGGTQVPPPPEVQNLRAQPTKQDYTWDPEPAALRYDVVRGFLGALPVGPGGGDETCFDDILAAPLNDPGVPSPGQGFFYVVRAEHACGNGPYGNGHVNPGPPLNGPPRVTATCP